MTAPTVITTAYAYRKAQDAALKPLLDAVKRLIRAYGVPVTPAQQAQFALLLLRPTRTARGRNFDAAVRYLNGHGIRDIPNQPGYPIQAVEKIVADVNRLRIAEQPLTEANRRDPQFVKAAEKSITGGLVRHAQDPARSVVKDVAESTDGIGWARMLTGPTSCSFCAMLASRGPVYSSRESAIGRGGDPMDRYHTAYLNANGKQVGGDCDCIAVLVTDFRTWEGLKSFRKLEDLWVETGKKQSNNAARKSFRRAWDQKIRDGDSSSFVSDSFRPPGGAS